VFLLVLLIITVSFFLKRHALDKERVWKINDFSKSLYQLNDSLKTATQTLYDILTVVENEDDICISERVNLLENHIKILNYCINHLNMVSGNSVVPDIRKTCLESIFVLEQAVKKTLVQLLNMNFIEHDFRDYFLKITEYRLNIIKLEKEFNKGNP
jgi:hypothetical protein